MHMQGAHADLVLFYLQRNNSFKARGWPTHSYMLLLIWLVSNRHWADEHASNAALRPGHWQKPLDATQELTNIPKATPTPAPK